MHFVYIIYSKSVDKYYIGESEDVKARIKLHNQGLIKSAFTRIAKDWKLVFKHKCKNRQEALFLERFINCMKSRKFIEKLISNPEICTDVLNKYNRENK